MNFCFQLTETVEETDQSVLWKALEQVYRFGLGSVAGGKWNVTQPIVACTFKV